jgi:hypothetical protein
MWTNQQDLIFSSKMALRGALSVLRGMRKSLTNEQQDVVEDLRRQNWKIEKGPEPEGHSRIMGRGGDQ